MQVRKGIIITLLAPILLSSGSVITKVHADALDATTTTAPTKEDVPAVSIKKDTPIITTEDNEVYKQLQATSENLKQKINDLTISDKASTDITQAKIAGMKVHLSNLKSQMQVVLDKQEAERKRVAEEKRKAEAEKAAEEKRKADEKAAKEKQEADTKKDLEAAKATAMKQTDISTAELSNASELRQKIVAKAKEYLGREYVWGGASPETGFDCSGLTSYVYRVIANVETGRTTWNQDAKGTHIGLNELKPGDLILQNSAEHIAMYIGDGMQIESPQPGDVIRISKVPANPWSMYGLRFID